MCEPQARRDRLAPRDTALHRHRPALPPDGPHVSPRASRPYSVRAVGRHPRPVPPRRCRDPRPAGDDGRDPTSVSTAGAAISSARCRDGPDGHHPWDVCPFSAEGMANSILSPSREEKRSPGTPIGQSTPGRRKGSRRAPRVGAVAAAQQDDGLRSMRFMVSRSSRLSIAFLMRCVRSSGTPRR